MEIAIIGTGYVGTVAGACFAEAGNDVICVDQDAQKIEELSAGAPVIFEPGLEELLKKHLKSGRLQFTTSIPEAVRKSEIIFLTVGTPAEPSGQADLRQLREAVREIGRAMNAPKIILNKSTVPVGTHEAVTEWLRAETELPFETVSNPEFLREGSAVKDFLFPERVVIGTDSRHARETMKQLYAPFLRHADQILAMDPVSAELAKYASNAFLATRISFMNELAGLCEGVGADVESVRQVMALDSRIGEHFLYPGIGFGGSCFPKDLRALLAMAAARNISMPIIESVESVNARQKRHLLRAMTHHFGEKLQGVTFGVWGLAFKPETDDMREAPALAMIEHLLNAGVRIRAYDPVAMPNARRILGPRIEYCASADDAIHGADGLIVATEWKEFRKASLERVKALLRTPVVFDGRNLFAPEHAARAGLAYYGVGRGHALPTPARPVRGDAIEPDIAIA